MLRLIALCHALAARLWAATAPAPLALPPATTRLAELEALTVAELRRLAAQSRRYSRRFYTYGRRAELLAALA